MSLGARATRGGAKAAVGKDKHGQDRAKVDKPPAKDKVKPQATTEQLRMANMIDRKNDDTLDVRRMVLELMDMTRRTEEEVCSALHDADNNVELACDMLLEEAQRIQGEWQTNEKKKKKSGGGGAGNGDVEPPPSSGQRSRSGPRQRRDGGSGEGQRGRGGGRGRGSARGGRAGGRGPARPRPGGARPRPNTHDSWPDAADDNATYGSSGGNFNSNEDWESDDKYVAPATAFPAAEDWDNDEWSGSLADTKVFTPSIVPQPAEPDPAPQLNNSLGENWEITDSPTDNGLPSDAGHLSYTYHNSTHQLGKESSGLKTLEGGSPVSSVDLSHVAARQPVTSQPIGLSGSLSAAQSQYLSQLTQQSQQHDSSVYSSNYGVYSSTELTTQRKPQRARVPPPSKIPSSAVEMPGGEAAPVGFIDVQFGALEPETLADTIPTSSMLQQTPKQTTLQTDTAPTHSTHETVADTNNYSSAASMLSETLSAVDATPSSQTVTVDAVSTSAALESRLTASMKQLSTSDSQSAGSTADVTSQAAQYASRQQQQYPQSTTSKHQSVAGQQSVYAHHPVSHHPVYGANVYAQQVNSTNASLTVAPAMTSAYPAAVTLPQYHTQPLNSYQQTSSTASVYGGSTLYTAAAPYTAYQPTTSKLSSGDKTTYDRDAAQRALPAAAKPAGPTPAKVTSASNVTATQYAVQAQPQPQAFYTQQQGQAGAAAAYAAYAAEEAQMMRGTLPPHHMLNNGGYYEVGYGVTPAREPAAGFGLGAGERFGRADASSPQHVAALPPGYTYYYQAQPYQYGVYPYGGGGSNVASVSGKVAGYTQPAQYDAQQESYKQGAYSGTAKAESAQGADLTRAMYKAHTTLNKVNSYDKAAFHSGTPPPFGGGSAPHHLYIPHNPHHQQQHQESTGAASRGTGNKTATNKPYSQSYWAPN